MMNNAWRNHFALKSVAVCVFLVPAKLSNVSGDQTVHEGTNMQLFCEAAGKPKPTIIWTKKLDDGSNSGVLHQGATWNFTNISRTDSGTYHCETYNGAGNPVSSQAIQVTVTCKYIQHRSSNYNPFV